jgi:MFS family permease
MADKPDFWQSRLPGTDSRDAGNAADGRFTRAEVMALVAILTGSFITVLDYFLTLVALPTIQRELGVSDAAAQLVLAIFGIANAAGLITGGRIGDLYGRKPTFLAGMLLFAAGALAASMATSTATLVFARAVQGFASAVIQPQVLALLGTRFTGHKSRRAFAAFSVAMGLGAVIGQLVGGALMNADVGGLGWRLCFLATLPLALLSLVMASRYIRSMGRPVGGAHPDGVGMALSALALVAFTWPLTLGRTQGSAGLNAALLAGSVLLALLLWRQQVQVLRLGGDPMLPIRLLRQRPAQQGLLAVFVFYTGVTSFYLILGWRLQRELGLSPMASGLMFALWGLGFLASSLLGPAFGRRYGRLAVAHGAVVLVLGHLADMLCAWTGAGLPWLTAAIVLEGLGMGFVMVPLTSLVLSRVTAGYAGAMSGVLGTVQAAGNAVGAAVVPLAYLSPVFAPAGALPLGGAVASMLVLTVIACAVAWLSLLTGRSTQAAEARAHLFTGQATAPPAR